MRTIKGVDDDLRLQIIKEYLSGSSQASLYRKYKLRDKASIRKWMVIFGIVPAKDSEEMKKEKSPDSEELRRLQLENKELRRQLSYEQMKSKAYDTMIDVAEEMFQIPIRKKPGTKQS